MMNARTFLSHLSYVHSKITSTIWHMQNRDPYSSTSLISNRFLFYEMSIAVHIQTIVAKKLYRLLIKLSIVLFQSVECCLFHWILISNQSLGC
jgi:hypothetical protein